MNILNSLFVFHEQRAIDVNERRSFMTDFALVNFSHFLAKLLARKQQNIDKKLVIFIGPKCIFNRSIRER